MTGKFSSHHVSKIGIVGAGNMGSSIAVAASALGVPVKLIDTSWAVLEDGLRRIDGFFGKLEHKAEEDKALLETLKLRRSLIKPVETYQDFSDVDFVIEAVNEDIQVKKAVLEKLDEICSADAIFASNTSSFSITQLASFTKRDKQVIGLHFFNPAHLMQLVEVIPGLNTDPEIVNFSLDFARRLGKMPVKVKDCASFLINRLLGRYMNEAIWVLQHGLADVTTIDEAACQLLMPIGPLQLRDMNGLDIGLSVARVNYAEYGERFKPPPLLEKMVELNMLGKKSQAGFYTYDQESRKPVAVNPRLLTLLPKKTSLIHCLLLSLCNCFCL